MIGELLVFVGVVAVVAIVGVLVGMLVAPRVARLSERIAEPKDEETGDGLD